MFSGFLAIVSSVDDAGKEGLNFQFWSVKTCKRLRCFLNEKYCSI